MPSNAAANRGLATTSSARRSRQSFSGIASGDFADAELAELAVEGGAADSETAGDLGHSAAIMADGEPDHVGLYLLEAAHVAVAVVEGDAGRVVEGRGLRGAVQQGAVEI